MIHSDSGTVMWWDRKGEKVLEFVTGLSDIVVHMDWSVSGKGLWMFGFSCLAYYAVERNEDGRGRCSGISSRNQLLFLGTVEPLLTTPDVRTLSLERPHYYVLSIFLSSNLPLR